MSAAIPAGAVAMMVALLLALAVAAASRAFRGPVPGGQRPARQASTPSMFAGIGSRRVVSGAVTAVLVLMLTRWVLLALFAGVLVVMWGRLLHDDRADVERARVEGIATWLDDLRDTLRGSSMGVEEALDHVAHRPPHAIEPAMRHYLLHRRQGFRTDDALVMLADDLAHPTADAAVAALSLVVGGSSSAGRLYGTVDALAQAARDEVTARERIDRTRSVYQSSMQRLVVIGALLVAYLRFAGGDLLDPYDSTVGQVVLVVPLAMWLGCVLWLRSLCRYELPERGRMQQPVRP